MGNAKHNMADIMFGPESLSSGQRIHWLVSASQLRRVYRAEGDVSRAGMRSILRSLGLLVVTDSTLSV